MTESNVRVVGRYALYNAIAAGGMATVHLGRLLGPVGFSRTVAIKRLHAQFASDPEFVSMFLDEARLAARIRHPNVVQTVDVVATAGELFLVMDYVPGESVARLMRVLRERQQTIPLRILSAVMSGALHGLHAAHEAKDERGHPLGIVHRDVSPQNVILGTDGSPRVLDFGVAKAAGRVQTTREGQIKGKLSYMPPEQLRGASVDRKTDIYAAGVMVWELLTGQRLFAGDNEGAVVAKVLEGRVEPPSQVLMRSRRMTLTDVTMRQLEGLDQTILKALSMDPSGRHATAREMAIEIERRLPPATASECADWLESIARDVLASRAALIAEIESSASHVVDESHIMSVLNAKATLGPSSSLVTNRNSSSHDLSGSGSIPGVRQSAPQLNATMAMPQGVGPGTGMNMKLQMPASGRYPMAIEGPPVTQPSSISVTSQSASSQQEKNNGTRNAIAAMIGVFIGATVLGGALWWNHRQAGPVAEDPTLPAPSASLAAPAPIVTTADPVHATPPGSSTLPPRDQGEIADVVDAGSPKTPKPNPIEPEKRIANGGRPSTPGPLKPPAPPPAPAPQPNNNNSSANSDCATPYWYDAQGVKHYKPQCLQKQ
ncbi:MAG: serine/threonine-protein kinase [Labilithrix sp.]